MNKKTTKKLAGGFMIAVMLAVIGAVFVTAETGENADEQHPWHVPFGGKGCDARHMGMNSDLTEEQKAEIDELITSLKEEGATAEEIREAMIELLDELGVLDERLDMTINHTEEKLEVLNRQKELRDQGYSWDEINEIINEEFDLEFPIGFNGDMKGGRGCHPSPRFGGKKFFMNEDSGVEIVESS